MRKLAWDFFLSFSIRAVFTLALLGGVNFLVWTYNSWRTGLWEGDPLPAQLSLLLASVTTLVGLMGTFRKGKAEARFSLFSMAVIVTELVVNIQLPKAHIHLPETHVGERTLRRFPSVESFLLGGFLIALWLFPPFWQGEVWIFRNAAIVGGSQILWGMGVEVLGGSATVGPREGADERSPDGPMDAV